MRGVIASFGLLLGAAEAHVSMVYKDGQAGGIRNANTPTGNGQASVQKNCGDGGRAAFGSNGVATLKDGDTVTYAMRYAAGHNGNFRMAYACGTQDGSALEAPTAALTGCTATGGAGAYNGADGAQAQGQNTMDITCPLTPQGNTDPTDCVIGILDQRDWGGCIDVNLLSAADPAPPSPPPAPFVSSVGTYAFQNARKVDTSAGNKDGIGTFSCCAISEGALVIPQYNEGQATVLASFQDAKAKGCPATVPVTTVAPPPNDREVVLSSTDSFTMQESNNGNKYTGFTYIADQQFEVVVAGGVMTFTNTYQGRSGTEGEQPIVCDGTSELGLALSTDGAGGGGSSTAIIIVLLLIAAGGAFVYMKMKKEAAAKAAAKGGTPTYNSSTAAPPPPPVADALPPGWTEQKDPTTGTAYYYNSNTGESSWTRPGARV